MKKGRTYILGLLIMLLAPLSANAQWSFDVGTVEAYINDHKQQRSLLLARSTLEHSNKLLHEYSRKETVGYKELNVDLDKYTRAFDYKAMLEDFNEKVIKRKHIELADTLILSINAGAIRMIAQEGEYLYKSVSDLVLYATGAAACSTSDLLMVLNSVNCSLDNIEKHLNRAYFETWRYIQVRIGYWKEKVYRTKTKRELIDDAFGRWRQSGKLDY